MVAMKILNSVMAFAAGLSAAMPMPAMLPPRSGFYGVAPSACRGVYSRYRNRKANVKPPHQGARECARRRKQMGTGEFAPKRFAA